MRYRPLGESGIEASVVGLGAWAIGGWLWGGTDDKAAAEAIRAAIDAGISLLDTAPIYGFGHSEEVVGKAIQGRREQVVLATKCGLVWHTDKGDHFFNSDEKRPRQDAADKKVYRYLGPESIQYEVEQSLKRLKVEAIDLYQTHWQETVTPIPETMEALMKLKEQGKIRAIGVSNATPAQMDEYCQMGAVDADQEKFNMLQQEKALPNLAYCAKHGLAFLAYSPIAQGLLTGKVGPERTFPESDVRHGNAFFSVENRKKTAGFLEKIKPAADGHNLTLAQLAIAWAVHQPGCTHALVGARNPEQALENAKAGDAVLSADELSAIDEELAGLGKL